MNFSTGWLLIPAPRLMLNVTFILLMSLMPIFACHSFCSVPCSIQFHCFMLKIWWWPLVWILVINMNYKINPLLLCLILAFVLRTARCKRILHLTFLIFFQQKISCLFIYLFNKYLESDCHSFMPGNTAIRMMYIVFAFV